MSFSVHQIFCNIDSEADLEEEEIHLAKYGHNQPNEDPVRRTPHEHFNGVTPKSIGFLQEHQDKQPTN